MRGFESVKFTGAGDDTRVIAMYRRFANDINEAMGNSGGRVGVRAYSGEYNAANEREGVGTLWTALGDVYQGDFKLNQYEGQGTCDLRWKGRRSA